MTVRRRRSGEQRARSEDGLLSRSAKGARSVCRKLAAAGAARLPATQRQLLKELRVYARALCKRSSGGERILIFAQGRTGTTLLESLLASTELFHVNDEPLRGKGKYVRWPALYLRGLARDPALQGQGGNFVCHVKIYHLDEFRKRAGRRPVEPTRFLNSLTKDGWKIVHVSRKNTVRQVLSQYVAEARGGYHKHDDKQESHQLLLDRSDFKRRLKLQENRSAQERAALGRLEHVALTYEDDLLDPAVHEQTVDRVLAHADLQRSHPVRTSLRKINAQPLRELILNYEEFLEWVRDLDLAELLDTPDDPPSVNATEDDS